ncbi:MAG: type I-E CRISPR-associated protein Cse1/CasA [Candidatus Syntrophosphaera sp.]|nr:type I-E CRISPR-associated protein Cse1/CasA [Candidatus Cloacimonadota bacterium]MDX9950338.1 type I-E CRISPR-associated protein Cse1/CasA [Candidatus Syntrophosphaera sp.]
MYNLLEQDWVRVLYRSGEPKLISLSRLHRDADKLHLAYSNPMDRLAVFRFLLALGYWCFANTNQTPARDKPIPEAWLSWLEENKQYLKLYGDGPRMYQDPGVKRTRPITDLLHEIPTGNNLSHFKHTLDYVSGLCLPCCIQGLLRFPIYATSGLPQLKASINGMPPFYALPWGNTLAETLYLNWEPRELMGTPAWVFNTVDPEDGPVPLLEGLTSLARRCVLHDPIPGDGACSACGDRSGSLVYSCGYDTAGVVANPMWEDPHVCYDVKKTKANKALNLISEKPMMQDRNWQRAFTGSSKLESGDESINLLCIGVSVNQAVINDVWESTIRIPPREAGKDPKSIPNWTWINRRLVGGYERNRLYWADKSVSGKPRAPLSESLISAVSPHILHYAIQETGGFLPDNGELPKSVQIEYRNMLKAVAKSQAPAVTIEDAIASKFVHNQRPQLEQAKASKQDKKEDQVD